MKEKVLTRNLPVNFETKGSGFPLVFVHGYLESAKIWGSFSDKMAEWFWVINIDLPGFGLSEAWAEAHTMEIYAEAILAVTNFLRIDNFVLIGHSLGGYVSLAFLEKYSAKLKGLCLFHSHPNLDSKETIDKRKREIALVKAGKQELIFNINIPNGFSVQNLARCSHDIDFAKTIAAKTNPEGIMAALKGMMLRPSRVKLLQETSLPVLLILGRHDNYIPYEETGLKIKLPKQGKIVTLKNSGHMGFIEEPGLSASVLTEFINTLTDQAGRT